MGKHPQTFLEVPPRSERAGLKSPEIFELLGLRKRKSAVVRGLLGGAWPEMVRVSLVLSNQLLFNVSASKGLHLHLQRKQIQKSPVSHLTKSG